MTVGFLLKSWDVTVEGYGEEQIVAASRGKALAKAWRCDAFNHFTFADFLKIARACRAMLVSSEFGKPILVQGRPAFNVGRHYSYVTFVWPWTETVLNSHPADVTAIADTHPEDGDVQQAPLGSGGGARSAIARRKP